MYRTIRPSSCQQAFVLKQALLALSSSIPSRLLVLLRVEMAPKVGMKRPASFRLASRKRPSQRRSEPPVKKEEEE
eukprot:12308860-Alexandrium_andersonii.AAC.1